MGSFKFGLNLQLTLVIITTAIAIVVVDNILDAIRTEQATTERDVLFNQTEQTQQDTQAIQEQHHNITAETLEFIINSTARRDVELAPIYEQFQGHMDAIRENNELLRNLTRQH